MLMKLFIMTWLAQVILCGCCVVEFRRMQNKLQENGLSTENRLYGHEIGSLIDTHKILSKVVGVYIVAILFSIMIIQTNWINRVNLMDTGTMFLVALITAILAAVYLVCPFCIAIFSFYAFSEIKHLSPNDGIYESAKEGIRYYKKTSLLGAISFIIILTHIARFPIWVEVFYYVGIFITICLGMGDVLQSSNYNSPKQNISRLKTSFRALFEIVKNIITYIINKQERKKYNKVMKYNFANIYLGIKQIKISFEEG